MELKILIIVVSLSGIFAFSGATDPANSKTIKTDDEWDMAWDSTDLGLLPIEIQDEARPSIHATERGNQRMIS